MTAGNLRINAKGNVIKSVLTGNPLVDCDCCPHCKSSGVTCAPCGCNIPDVFWISLSGFAGGCADANGFFLLSKTGAHTYTGTTPTGLVILLTLSGSHDGSWSLTVDGGTCLGPTGAAAFTGSCCIEGVVSGGVTISAAPQQQIAHSPIEVTFSGVTACSGCINALCPPEVFGFRFDNVVLTGLNGTHELEYDEGASSGDNCLWTANVGNLSFDTYTDSGCTADQTGRSGPLFVVYQQSTAGNFAGLTAHMVTDGPVGEAYTATIDLTGVSYCDAFDQWGTESNILGCCRRALGLETCNLGTASINFNP